MSVYTWDVYDQTAPDWWFGPTPSEDASAVLFGYANSANRRAGADYVDLDLREPDHASNGMGNVMHNRMLHQRVIRVIL